MKKTIQKIKCFFGNHIEAVVERKRVRGILFGKMVDATRYGCLKCNYKRNAWCVTEGI